MASVQVTGPVYHYIALPGDHGYPRAWFLGTSKTAPKIRIETQYAPIMFSQGGLLLPFDLTYQGKLGRIITQLNYFEDGVLRTLQASPRFTRSKLSLGPGLESFRDIGSMVLGDKGYFSLYVVYPFYGSINALPSGQPKPYGPWLSFPQCYRFPACTIEAIEDTGGTGERNVVLAIRANRVYYNRNQFANQARGSPLAGGFFLYDNALPTFITPGYQFG